MLGMNGMNPMRWSAGGRLASLIVGAVGRRRASARHEDDERRTTTRGALPVGRTDRATPSCRILVPSDFSAASDAAIEYARFLAARVGGAVDVLYVWDPRARRDGRVAHLLADRRHAKVEIKTRVVVGDLGEHVLRVVTSEHFDLLVMGGAEHAIAHDIAHSVRCPVLEVRAGREDDVDRATGEA
jgi:nucleotide-binding universal stress UspA family protein